MRGTCHSVHVIGHSSRFVAALGWAAGLGLAAKSAWPQDSTPTFRFAFSPCPAQINVLPGNTFERVFDCVIVTEENPDPTQGAQGWSLSLSADNLDFVSATTNGTLAARVTDDPPGLLDNGFEKTEVATGRGTGDCVDRQGVISAIVLSFTEIKTLPREGSAAVCRLKVSGQAPATEGDTKRARLFYVDGCGGSG